MRKLREVEEAKALMAEAVAWSVMKWLREKKRVREVADRANAALDEFDRSVKAQWSHEVRKAYDELVPQTGTETKERRSPASAQKASAITDGVRHFARRVKEADEAAYRARMDAERTFDEAERLMSTSLAREGCHKAIHSWDLHEKAIRQAEA